jgi:hypothetical protein
VAEEERKRKAEIAADKERKRVEAEKARLAEEEIKRTEALKKKQEEIKRRNDAPLCQGNDADCKEKLGRCAATCTQKCKTEQPEKRGPCSDLCTNQCMAGFGIVSIHI